MTHCQDCAFGQPTKFAGAIPWECHRFPRIEHKDALDWCGEGKAKEVGAYQSKATVKCAKCGALCVPGELVVQSPNGRDWEHEKCPQPKPKPKKGKA